MRSYFIWNGIDSRSMEIITRHHAPLIRPEERVSHVQIPGLSGDLTETEGEHIYNSYIQTVEFSVLSGSRVRSVFAWLRGSGYVTFSSDPDKRQRARVIGAVTLEKVSRNMDHWAGQAQFYCQPLKERIYDIYETLTASGSVYNAGDVASHPLIRMVKSASSSVLTVNGKSLTIAGGTGTVLIDCLAQEITNNDRTSLLTVNSSGAFPELEIGSNTIGGSGWSKLEIYKRERFL